MSEQKKATEMTPEELEQWLDTLEVQILLVFLGVIGATGITLIFSAVCKNQLVAFAISAVVYAIPIMLPIPETSALYRFVVLMPLYCVQCISVLAVQQMGNGMLYAVWAAPVAVLLGILGAVISRRRFIKHQVS